MDPSPKQLRQRTIRGTSPVLNAIHDIISYIIYTGIFLWFHLVLNMPKHECEFEN